MLYIDYAKYKEDFILENENNYPTVLKDILYVFRKLTGQVIKYELNGKNVVLISKLNKYTFSKLNKIFKIDVTKNICVCDYLIENQKFLDFLNEKKLKLIDGKWLFKYLICDIAKYICNKLNLTPENQEITLLVNESSSYLFDMIKNLSSNFKNITIITNEIKKFDKIEKQIYEEIGLALNITNNFNKACLKSKIVFNIDFDESNFNKVVFLPTAIIINLKEYIEIKQSNFIGKNIDFYGINLPQKYKKIYDRLNGFNSSNLYESFIYKNTLNQNIWDEISNDNIEIIALESKKKTLSFTN